MTMRAKNDLTFFEVAEFLAYDGDSGVLTWRKSNSYVVKAGDVAGSHNSTGHLHVQLFGRKYKAHRLAWLLHTGLWPREEVDHINRVRDDNRFCNLREATQAQNTQNTSLYRSNKFGFPGVYPRSCGKKFYSKIKANGHTHYLGNFATPIEAAAAFAEAKRLLHPFSGALN